MARIKDWDKWWKALDKRRARPLAKWTDRDLLQQVVWDTNNLAEFSLHAQTVDQKRLKQIKREILRRMKKGA